LKTLRLPRLCRVLTAFPDGFAATALDNRRRVAPLVDCAPIDRAYLLPGLPKRWFRRARCVFLLRGSALLSTVTTTRLQDYRALVALFYVDHTTFTYYLTGLPATF